MNIGSLTKSVNSLAEENFQAYQIVEFVNDCIARINITCEANFPFMNLEDSSEYIGFTEKWQRALFVPFVVGRMKTVEASQFEYMDQYTEFNNNLGMFKSKYQIPDGYKDSNEKTSFEPDFTGNYFTWNGSGTNGSDPLS